VIGKAGGWGTLAYMSSVGQVQLVPSSAVLMFSLRRLAASLEVVATKETGVVEEVEPVWPARKTRHCERTLLWREDSRAQGSPGMVKANVQDAIDVTLREKCCCAVLSDSRVGSVVWRINCLMLVAQADQLSVAQVDCLPGSACKDPT
jgi:hypothetical protein